jgi:hypothetical protein
MQPLPLTWLQRTVIGAPSVSNPTFYYPPGMGGEKSCHYSCHVKHCSTINTPSTHKKTTTTPGFSGARPYPFLIDPLSYVLTRPRPPPVYKGMTPARRLQGIARSTQDLGSFIVPSSTSPRHPGDSRPLPEHAATATSTAPIEPSPLRHRLKVLGALEPSLDHIKGRAEGSPGRTEEKR